MGHISNPIGLRVGYTRSWLNKLQNPNIQYLNDPISLYIKKFFNTKRMRRRLGLIFSHVMIFPQHIKFPYICIYIYDATLSDCAIRFFETFGKRPKISKSKKKILNKLLPKILRKKKALRNRTAFQPNTLPLTFTIIRKALYTKCRYLFWIKVRQRLINLLAIQLKICHKEIRLNFKLLNLSNITARTLINLTMRDLKKRHVIRNLTNKIMDRLEGSCFGLSLNFFGRFTRRQRAGRDYYHMSKTPKRTFRCDLDYARGTIRLLYGVGTIHILINRGYCHTYPDFKFIGKKLYRLKIPRFLKNTKKKRNKFDKLKIKTFGYSKIYLKMKRRARYKIYEKRKFYTKNNPFVKLRYYNFERKKKQKQLRILARRIKKLKKKKKFKKLPASHFTFKILEYARIRPFLRKIKRKRYLRLKKYVKLLNKFKKYSPFFKKKYIKRFDKKKKKINY
jgi:ribosomal protein S3